MKPVGSGVASALRAVKNAGEMEKLQFINTGLIPLAYTNFVSLGNHEKKKNCEREKTETLNVL